MTELSSEPPGGRSADPVLPAGGDSGVVGTVGQVAAAAQVLAASPDVTESVTNGNSDKKVPCESLQQMEKEGRIGVPVEVWDRVVGYLRPVRDFNPGKQQERKDRLNYSLGPETITTLNQ